MQGPGGVGALGRSSRPRTSVPISNTHIEAESMAVHAYTRRLEQGCVEQRKILGACWVVQPNWL